MNTAVDLSVIIVSWNVRDALRDCLASLQKTTQDISFEIILIDNASADGTEAMVRSEFPDIPIEVNKTNEGLAKPWNRAARRARGEYLLFLNDDTVIFDHTLDLSVSYARQHPHTGVLGCSILNPDRSRQQSVRRFPTVFDQSMIIAKVPHIWPRVLDTYTCQGFDYATTSAVDQVMGAYFMIPRSVFTALGGFDEGFFIWFEEVDFCRRAKNQGYEVTYFADAEIIHKGGASFKQLPTVRLQKIFLRSMMRYFYKHHWLVRWIHAAIS